jgi:alpha-ketoglutarate-dependent 2,4-dichlorophenoxyacetate dioxygenase
VAVIEAGLDTYAEHATQREFVYSHAWTPHDLVMWDNRTTMHRACVDHREVRDVRRTTLAGHAPQQAFAEVRARVAGP